MAPSLLFIPDISGFTKFVSSTEVEHGRHIIAELLELIIESNHLDLTVSELEGDAVFFYRDGPLPSFDEIVDQARTMFEAFHRHLRSYEVHRICPCGACSSAQDLTLKIVVHAGPIERLSVRGFEKPFGTDVIVAHRLLKNDLADSEYLLVTDAALEATEAVRDPEWAYVSAGTAVVDDVGPVPYRWMSLAPLRATIPAPRSPATPGEERAPLHARDLRGSSGGRGLRASPGSRSTSTLERGARVDRIRAESREPGRDPAPLRRRWTPHRLRDRGR